MKFKSKSKIEKSIILLQGIICLYFIYLLFQPCYTLQVKDDINNDYVLSNIHGGAYEISIRYNANLLTDDEQITFTSNKTSDGMMADDIVLDNKYGETQERFWLKAGYCYTDVVMHIEGNSEAIQSIFITEKYVYRVMRLIGLLILFGSCNALFRYFMNPEKDANKKKRVAACIGCTVFSSLLCFIDFTFISDDLHFHLRRIVNLAQAMEEGQIPQRMSLLELNGFGYATPLFYGEIFLVIPSVLYMLYVPLQFCYQIFVVFVNLATYLICEKCMEAMGLQKRIAVMGAFLYTLSSYRLLNIWVRGAVGEYLAMAFFPLVLYGFWRVYNKSVEQKPSIQNCLPLVLGLTAVIQSHILSCEMIAILVMLYVLFHVKDTFRKPHFQELVIAVILTGLLNLWFLVPFLTSLHMDMLINYVQNRISLGGLYPIEIWGSFCNVADDVFGSTGHTMYQEQVKTLGPALVFGIFLFVCCFIHQEECKKKNELIYKMAHTFWGLSIVTLILSLEIFPYDMLASYNDTLARLIGTIQFPWRYLGFASVFLTMAISCSLEMLDILNKKEIVRKGISILLILTIGWYYLWGMDFINVTPQKQLYSGNSVRMESALEYSLEPTLTKGITDESYEDNSILTSDHVKILKYQYEKREWILTYDNQLGEPESIVLPIQGYDNYHVYQDGEELVVSKADNGRLCIQVRPGSGKIIVRYVEPVLWRISEIISMCVALGIVVYYHKKISLIWKNKNKGRKQ